MQLCGMNGSRTKQHAQCSAKDCGCWKNVLGVRSKSKMNGKRLRKKAGVSFGCIWFCLYAFFAHFPAVIFRSVAGGVLEGANEVFAVLYADGNDNVLEEMAEAFQKPQNILFLGRKSCPPSGRIFHGIVEADSVENALSSLPYLGDEKTAGMDENIRLDAWIPGDSGEDATLIPDVPVSFSVSHREYTSRIISKISVHVRNPFYTVTHDPMDFEEGINVHL